MAWTMQEHIEWLKKERDLHGYEKHPYFECAIEHAESMLEKEKEVIVDAVKHGCSDWGSWKDAEQYYNETFNTKER